ncbi:non-oxidative hydroxyarylic acid decarboxylases subunit D [Orbus wheelerorum]|uniref:non-oxidative hydroxyarylic acid decarboxylases subunit D n=1 Tax=Orbus wheelerorum TaxID=3074111 RepID=UPI00370DCF9A
MTKIKQPEMCPRCESLKPETLCHSPVKNAWIIYHCPVCFFTWRNTEPDFITDPAQYNPHFKFKPESIDTFDIMPAIPELKR